MQADRPFTAHSVRSGYNQVDLQRLVEAVNAIP